MFRNEQTIEFSDLDVFAAIGTTGPGKRSILEAMVYALYDRTAFGETDIDVLAASGADAMRVELTFSVDEAVYVVTRARSRSRTSDSENEHRLRAEADPQTRARGSADVSAEIVRITGVEPAAFLRAATERASALGVLLSPREVEAMRASLGRAAEKARELCIAFRRELETFGRDPRRTIAETMALRARHLAAEEHVTETLKAVYAAIHVRDAALTQKRRFDDLRSRIGSFERAASELAALERAIDAMPLVTVVAKKGVAAVEAALAIARAADAPPPVGEKAFSTAHRLLCEAEMCFAHEVRATQARVARDLDTVVFWATLHAWCEAIGKSVHIERDAAESRARAASSEIDVHLARISASSVTEANLLLQVMKGQLGVLTERAVRAQRAFEDAERASARLREIEPALHALEFLAAQRASERRGSEASGNVRR